MNTMTNAVALFLQNEAIEHDLLQGSEEWENFRFNHDGASEAPAQLGLSKKVQRNELLYAKKTGIAKTFSKFVEEHIFGNGHAFEALARPIVQRQRGIKLYPQVVSRGRLSASCDGITMNGKVGWEHKQWNEELAAAVRRGELPEEFMAQPQQCMLVTGAEKWIFTVSDGSEEKMVSMEILPDPVWFERILLGWEQFYKDMDAYEHIEHVERPKANITIPLPVLLVEAEGKIISGNMIAFGEALKTRLAEVRSIALVTEQDLSNGKQAAKLFREKALQIKTKKAEMLAQTATLGEAIALMDAWAKDLNETALQLEKDCDAADLKKKSDMITKATLAFAAHVAALEAETKPLLVHIDRPNFAAVIKGRSNYNTMQSLIDTKLSQTKMEADAIARDLRDKLRFYHETVSIEGVSYEFLFADLERLVSKPFDDFKLQITSRIEHHQATEAAREAVLKAQLTPAPAVASVMPAATPPGLINTRTNPVERTATFRPIERPSDEKLIELVANSFSVRVSVACGWIIEIADHLRDPAYQPKGECDGQH